MSIHEKLSEINSLMSYLNKEYPAETKAFVNFVQKSEEGPVLGRRMKELINVALSVAAQCEWCIAIHVKGALEAGASGEEVMTAGFMAVLMHGGPALMYLTPIRQAIEELGGEQKSA